MDGQIVQMPVMSSSDKRYVQLLQALNVLVRDEDLKARDAVRLQLLTELGLEEK